MIKTKNWVVAPDLLVFLLSFELMEHFERWWDWLLIRRLVKEEEKTHRKTLCEQLVDKIREREDEMIAREYEEQFYEELEESRKKQVKEAFETADVHQLHLENPTKRRKNLNLQTSWIQHVEFRHLAV